MGPLEWIGEQAEGAWNAVAGAAEDLWHKVVHFVFGVIHGITGWLVGLFGVVIWAWNHLVAAAEVIGAAVAEAVGEAASFLWTLAVHTIPSIWRHIEAAAIRAWHWVEHAVAWAAKHIAHLAAQAWHWVENALKWVTHHVLRPLERLAAYVWDHLTRWAHLAWYLVTHPAKLAEILLWPLVSAAEQIAWQLARRFGEWLAKLVLHNMVKVAHLVEDVLAAIL